MKFVRLFVGGVGDFPAAVSDVGQEEAREPVEVALAVVIEDVTTFAAHDDRVAAVLAQG